MTLPRVVIAIDPDRVETMLAEGDLARLRGFAEVHIVECHATSTIEGVPTSDPTTDTRLAHALGDADALVVAHGAPRIDDAFLGGAPRLGFVGELEGDRFFGRIDLDAASDRGVRIVDTTHGSSRPVAEFALALMILSLRDAWRYMHRLRQGDEVAPTARTEPDRVVNDELEGRTVGLVGFGRIGWRLVELLQPFGVQVLAADPFAPRELADAQGVTFAPIERVFAGSDVVVCLAPSTTGTRGMIGGELLSSMRDGGVFINVGRGDVVHTDELVEVATRGRQIFCLDVLDPEPVPVGHPLRALPNVVLTPHLAGATGQSRRRFFSLMVDELERHFDGVEPRSAVTESTRAGRVGAPTPRKDPA